MVHMELLPACMRGKCNEHNLTPVCSSRKITVSNKMKMNDLHGNYIYLYRFKKNGFGWQEMVSRRPFLPLLLPADKKRLA